MTMTDERLAELDAAVAHDTRGVMTLLYKNYPDLRAHIEAQAATIARLDEALREIVSLVVEAIDLERIGAVVALDAIADVAHAAIKGAA